MTRPAHYSARRMSKILFSLGSLTEKIHLWECRWAVDRSENEASLGP
jgi:hypothetical protein